MYKVLQHSWAKQTAISCDCQMKKTERRAGRAGTMTPRQMNTKRERNISVQQQREEDGYKNVTGEATTENQKKDWLKREEESDGDTLYPIHHVVFKWLWV